MLVQKWVSTIFIPVIALGCRQRIHARPVTVGRPLRLLRGRGPAALPHRHDGPREAVTEDESAADVASHIRQLAQVGRDPQGSGRDTPKEPAPLVGVVAGTTVRSQTSE